MLLINSEYANRKVVFESARLYPEKVKCGKNVQDYPTSPLAQAAWVLRMKRKTKGREQNEPRKYCADYSC